MAWRNQGITGSNNIPLGNRRRFGGSDSTSPVDDGGYNPTQPSTGLSDVGYNKRGRSPVRAEPVEEDGVKRRKKRNRWGDAAENKAAGLMGLPTMIKANMTNEQLEAYTLHLRIQEISEKLRINDVVPADGDRSPSPPPQYDNFGRRVNTREYRYRKRLEDERHKQIEKAMKIIPNYHPPSDYRRPTKTQEKVYVPVNDYPEINFIGLLIGPRGNTLKKMETESQAKIAIRGKGSVKEGKGRSDAAHTSNQEEDLHCLIMADTEEKVNKAKKLIHNVIETAASIPEGQNELKRNQLRELAALNGTLRDDENQACQNCGQIGHRKYDCPEQRNFTANIICRVCGNAGHMARDCPDRQRGANWRNDAPGGPPSRAPAGRIGGGDAVDREYEQLMQELSGGAPAGNGQAPQRIEAGPGGYDQGNGDAYGEGERDLKPWQRGPTGAAAPWARGGDERGRRDDYAARDGGAAPPWAAGAGRGGDNYGYGQQPGGYGAPPPGPPGGAAPWQQQAPPPPPGGAQSYNGYGGYPGSGYGDAGGGYPAPQNMGAPPGLGGGAGGLGAPPGLGALFQNYGSGSAGSPPPPPPPGDVPPPPPSDQPPPPPPPGT
ncbi:MAG: branchpoint-bridging [Lasallia pustulata]|uniref:Branchpoint-bridging protein n=1 Tax=Lasallia pustulata TaxID=136370 RepID=A0A5M8PLM6_9LECA|nr:MAG: branchpoint-bridging [Lasallia pustulata]